jgi:hypothetical protein
MRIYVMITGGLFALLTLVHVWRLVEERNLATDPFFILITLLAAGLGVWALSLLRRSPRA